MTSRSLGRRDPRFACIHRNCADSLPLATATRSDDTSMVPDALGFAMGGSPSTSNGRARGSPSDQAASSRSRQMRSAVGGATSFRRHSRGSSSWAPHRRRGARAGLRGLGFECLSLGAAAGEGMGSNCLLASARWRDTLPKVSPILRSTSTCSWPRRPSNATSRPPCASSRSTPGEPSHAWSRGPAGKVEGKPPFATSAADAMLDRAPSSCSRRRREIEMGNGREGERHGVADGGPCDDAESRACADLVPRGGGPHRRPHRTPHELGALDGAAADIAGRRGPRCHGQGGARRSIDPARDHRSQRTRGEAKTSPRIGRE